MNHAASVVIFGAGPVGLLCMAVAKALGARKIIAVDIQQARLEVSGGPAPLPFSFPRLGWNKKR